MMPDPRQRAGLEPSCSLRRPFGVLRLWSRQGSVEGGFGDTRSRAPATGPAINKPVFSTVRPRSGPAAHLASRDGRKGKFEAAAMACATQRHGGDLGRCPTRIELRADVGHCGAFTRQPRAILLRPERQERLDHSLFRVSQIGFVT